MAASSTADPAALTVVCWGTRGSVPSPGPDTIRHGGNTSCVEIRTDDGRSLIFDAGTGIIPLARHLADDAGAPVLNLFLTHFHWDHIQGLPFFPPLREPAAILHIHGEPQDGVGVGALLRAQMRAPYFPVPLQQMPARIEYHELHGRAWRDDGVSVIPFRVRHAGYTCGFRIEYRGASVVYIPDNEMEGTVDALPASWEDDIIAFVGGADVLLHDAMFTADEYGSRRGWGHGTCEQAVRLARQADVRRLLLFHHRPERSDAELDDIVGAHQNRARAEGADLVIEAAVERREIVVPARRLNA
ncbi:MBL fold metallo-hydrolase [soil metagenome]